MARTLPQREPDKAPGSHDLAIRIEPGAGPSRQLLLRPLWRTTFSVAGLVLEPMHSGRVTVALNPQSSSAANAHARRLCASRSSLPGSSTSACAQRHDLVRQLREPVNRLCACDGGAGWCRPGTETQLLGGVRIRPTSRWWATLCRAPGSRGPYRAVRNKC